jgi:hypothetical protein
VVSALDMSAILFLRIGAYMIVDRASGKRVEIAA